MILWLRSLLFLSFGFSTVFVYATLVVLTFWVGRDWRHRVVVNYCNLTLWAGDFFCGMTVVVEGKENIPDEPSVIMIKHTSTLETYGHVPLFPTTAWVVKRGLTWAPIFGWAIGLVLEPIAIKRSARSNAVRQVIQQGKEKLAKEANVMIIPVAHNAGDFWRRREFTKRPGTIRFCIGLPINAQGRPPRDTNLIVQAWIEDKMFEISSTYRNQQEPT